MTKSVWLRGQPKGLSTTYQLRLFITWFCFLMSVDNYLTTHSTFRSFYLKEPRHWSVFISTYRIIWRLGLNYNSLEGNLLNDWLVALVRMKTIASRWRENIRWNSSADRPANNFPRAKLEENCELRGIENIQEQTFEHIGKASVGYCVCYSLNNFSQRTNTSFHIGSIDK